MLSLPTVPRRSAGKAAEKTAGKFVRKVVRKFVSRLSRGAPRLLAAALSAALLVTLAPPAAPWAAWPAAWPPASVALAADAGPPTDPSGAVYIGPGTTHRTIQTADGRSRGHLVVIDPEAGPIEIVAAMPGGVLGQRQTLTQQVAVFGQQAVAAINGDFFYNTADAPGAPVGMLVRDGELISSGTSPAIGIDRAGRPVTGRPNWTGRVQVLNAAGDVTSERRLCGVNKPRAQDCLVLYTPAWGPSTRTNEWGSEVLLVPEDPAALPLRPHTTFEAEVRLGAGRLQGGDAAIPAGGLVLSGHGAAGTWVAERVREGGRVRVVLEVDEAWRDVVHVIGGDPILVENGAPAALPASGMAVQRHPRTAVGIDRAGRWLWMVVDGRRPGWSEGVTLAELAQLMIQAGAWWALNLDGGGSTTMLVRPAGQFQAVVVNRPSDGQQRAIGPSWVAVSRALPGTAAYMWLNVSPSPDVPVLPGVAVEFQVVAQDRNHNPVAVDAASLTLVDGPDAAAILDRTFNGSRLRVVPGGPGVLAVRAANGLDAQAQVRVAGPADIARVEIQPDPASIQPGTEVTFTAAAYDAAGRLLPSVTESFAWAGTGDFAGISENGRVRLPAEYAQGAVTVSLRMVDHDGRRVDVPLRTLTLAVGEIPAPAFSDMEGHWAAREVATLTRLGVVQGYPDGTFGPSRSVTRAEFAVMLQRLLDVLRGTGATGGTNGGDLTLPFTDAADIPAWAATAIARATADRLLGGYPDGTFRPHQPISRQEAAALLTRVPEGPPATQPPMTFADAGQIAAWALPAVEAAVVRGLVRGYPDGTFGPLREITRAEAAAILMRLLP